MALRHPRRQALPVHAAATDAAAPWLTLLGRDPAADAGRRQLVEPHPLQMAPPRSPRRVRLVLRCVVDPSAAGPAIDTLLPSLRLNSALPAATGRASPAPRVRPRHQNAP